MRLRRLPRPELLPFIQELWYSDEPAVRPSENVTREHTLPTGQMHLVFRLGGDPVRIFRDAGDLTGTTPGRAVVGGARPGFYIKEINDTTPATGVTLKPGAALPLFGVPASEVADRHTPLTDLWPCVTHSLEQRLNEEASADVRLDVLEGYLLSRLDPAQVLHPAVSMALERFHKTSNVREVVAESGYSHRRFIALFREASGLTPKLYCRVRRFGRALRLMARDRRRDWTRLALDCGYSDQAHFVREFVEFTGMTPGEYRRMAPKTPHHCLAPEGQFSSRPRQQDCLD